MDKASVTAQWAIPSRRDKRMAYNAASFSSISPTLDPFLFSSLIGPPALDKPQSLPDLSRPNPTTLD